MRERRIPAQAGPVLLVPLVTIRPQAQVHALSARLDHTAQRRLKLDARLAKAHQQNRHLSRIVQTVQLAPTTELPVVLVHRVRQVTTQVQEPLHVPFVPLAATAPRLW